MRMLEATESITPGSCSASAMTCHMVSGLYLAAALCISAAISSSGNVLTRPPLVVDVCSGESSSPEGGGVVSLGGGVSSTSASSAGDTAPDFDPADAAAAAVFLLLFLSFSLAPPLSCRRAQRLRSHDATATNSAATSVAGPRRFLLRSVSRAALCAARNPGWFLAARHPVDRRRPLRSSAQSAALRPAARTARRSPPRGCAEGCWEAPHRLRGAGPIPLPRPTRREAPPPPPPGRTAPPPGTRPPAPAAGRSRSGGATTARPPAPGRGVPPRAHGAVRDVGAGRAPNPTDRAAAGRPPPCVGETPPRPPPLLRRPPPPSRAPPTRPTGRAPAPLRAPPKRSEERPRFERFRTRVARNTPPPTATAPGANSRPHGPTADANATELRVSADPAPNSTWPAGNGASSSFSCFSFVASAVD